MRRKAEKGDVCASLHSKVEGRCTQPHAAFTPPTSRNVRTCIILTLVPHPSRCASLFTRASRSARLALEMTRRGDSFANPRFDSPLLQLSWRSPLLPAGSTADH